MKAEIPHQTFGELSAPYHQVGLLQWLIHPKKTLKKRNKPMFKIVSSLSFEGKSSQVFLKQLPKHPHSSVTILAEKSDYKRFQMCLDPLNVWCKFFRKTLPTSRKLFYNRFWSLSNISFWNNPLLSDFHVVQPIDISPASFSVLIEALS